MKCRTLLSSLAAIAFSSLLCFQAAAAETGLRLFCEVEGRCLPLAGVEKDRLLMRNGDQLLPAALDAVWRLEGDVVAHSDLVRWFPQHTIERPAEFEIAARADQYEQVTIKVDHVATAGVGSRNVVSPFLRDWPDGLPHPGVIVALWLVEGRVVKILPFPLPATSEGSGFAPKLAFVLSREETVGQPALLLWLDGVFVAPTPDFDDPATQRAFVATLLDDVPALEQAIAVGAKLKGVSRSGANLAHYAAGVGAVRTLDFLLKRNPSFLNNTAKVVNAPLSWAALAGRSNTTQLLLAAKARPIAVGSESDPLESAELNGHIDVVRALVGAGARTEARSRSPLQAAISSGRAEIAECLLKAGGKFDFTRPGAEWAMVDSARSGNAPMVRLLLGHGVTPNALAFSMRSTGKTDPGQDTGITALMGAAEGKFAVTAGLLLEHGADPNRKTAKGVTTLQIAASGDGIAVVELLLAHGADVKARNQSGYSALDVALLDCSSESANALARSGARIDLKSQNASTLLEYAMRFDLPEVIAGALTDGWPVNSRLSGGWSALGVASEFGARACEQLLRAAGAVDAGEGTNPLVKGAELDSPLKLVKSSSPGDPRPDEDRTAQTVNVEFVVDRDGHPLLARVIDSSDQRLTAATLRTMPSWQFTKPTKNGQAVATRIALPVVFKGPAERNYAGISIRLPVAFKRVPPQYPHFRSDRGTAVLDFDVDAVGTVKNIKVKSFEPAFSDAAIAALKQWRFQPGIYDGRPASMAVELVFRFVPPYSAWAGDPYIAISEPAETTSEKGSAEPSAAGMDPDKSPRGAGSNETK